MRTTVTHSSGFILNIIPARVVVEERLDETIACHYDDTIASASPLPQIVERGKLADTARPPMRAKRSPPAKGRCASGCARKRR
jgi:hypothetical protein